MNCANHPDRPVAAYCQNCGKPLCSECMRSVAGQVFDEACLAAKLSGTPAGTPGQGWAAVDATVSQAAEPMNRAYGWSLQQSASPVLAGLLGFIPGVAAMYNGQFVKALAHVVVFIFLIGLTDHFALAGLLIAAWVFYQVFDGIQTAVARRDGLPLPDPFGLNDLGSRLGMPAAQNGYRAASAAGAGAVAGAAPGAASGPVGGTASGVGSVPPSGWAASGVQAPPTPGTNLALGSIASPYTAAGSPPPPPPEWGTPYATGPTPYAAVPPVPPVTPLGRPEPVGAIVLIVVGVLFLLSTLGVFHTDWIGRGWPVVLILLGVFLLVRRLRAVPRSGGAL